MKNLFSNTKGNTVIKLVNVFGWTLLMLYLRTVNKHRRPGAPLKMVGIQNDGSIKFYRVWPSEDPRFETIPVQNDKVAPAASSKPDPDSDQSGASPYKNWQQSYPDYGYTEDDWDDVAY